jgi:hypothetical protein
MEQEDAVKTGKKMLLVAIILNVSQIPVRADAASVKVTDDQALCKF